MNQKTETLSPPATATPTAPTQTDNLARIATALEKIADTNQQILSCAEDQLEILKEINQEFYSFSRHGFGM